MFVGAKCSKDIPYVQALASVVCAMKHKKLYGLDKEQLLQIVSHNNVYILVHNIRTKLVTHT